jgi:hypothetical protein
MTSKRRTEREFMQIKYLGYTRVADKTRQRGSNKVFIPAIIEAPETGGTVPRHLAL